MNVTDISGIDILEKIPTTCEAWIVGIIFSIIALAATVSFLNDVRKHRDDPRSERFVSTLPYVPLILLHLFVVFVFGSQINFRRCFETIGIL